MSRSTPTPPPRSVQALALALLARREHSRLELARKLALRGHPAELIDQTLDALQAEGLLSEERAQAARIGAGLRRQQGPRRIRADLARSGLDSEAALADPDSGSEVDWVAQARALLERRFGQEPPEDYREWTRRARFLQSRGYEHEQIREALGAVQGGRG